MALELTHLYPQLVASRSPVQSRQLYQRGRGVGGSSSVNGLFAIRATVEDFDGWAAAGCAGWGFDDVLPLLNRLENDQEFGGETYHGDAGPIPISRPPRESFAQFEAAIDKAAAELGHPWAPDHNAPGSTGVSPFAYNGIDGRRVSTNDAYLEPARDRSGLEIVDGAVVDRILFKETRAVGVRAIVNGKPTEFRATEIVVSGGAIHSPAILLRSGIGRAVDLRRLGIDPILDLPVGHNLQEHPSLAMGISLHEPPDYGDGPRRGQICLRFTTGVGNEVNDGMIAVVGALGLGVPATGMIGWGNRSTSTGRVQLTSLDPAVDPKVDFNLLSTPDDLQRFRAVVDEMRAIAAQAAFQKVVSAAALGAAAIAPDTPMSDREFAEFALANVGDTVHATGTCRMGAPDDPTSVVDPEGRVLGIQGLRVADMSVLPWVPRGNTNLTAIFVGERIAASIRGEKSQ